MGKTYITIEEIKSAIEGNRELIASLSKFEKAYVVTRGGLCAAGILAQYIDIRYFETICLRSYTDEKEQKKIESIKLTPTKEKVLIIEDIVDTGASMKFIKKYFPNAKFFALHVKPNITKIFPDYYLWQNDNWIVYPWERE